MTDALLETSAHDTRIASTLIEVVSAANRLTRVAARLTGETESPAVWRTLSVLSTTGPLRVGELAAESRVSQPTMTNIVRGLAEREWVLRIADTEDARAWRIAVTVEGAAALESWRSRIGDALLPTFSDLSDDDVDTLAKAVAIVHTRIAGELSAASRI